MDEATASDEQMLAECAALDHFRRRSDNLYERVRALFFLYALYRFHLPAKDTLPTKGFIPFDRLYEPARAPLRGGHRPLPGSAPLADGTASALAAAYHQLAFQTLANQVRRSVRSVRGNQWMFRLGHPKDQPLRVRPELYRAAANDFDGGALFPILHEVDARAYGSDPQRLERHLLSWAWTFPEGARVLNISVDLAVRGQGDGESGENNAPKPPIETFFRVIDRPVLRLVSVDLGATAEITTLAEVFDFAKDYLGPAQGRGHRLGHRAAGHGRRGTAPGRVCWVRLIKPGYGIELVSQVNDIPKGSRLAVSTNLLASLIAVCMRATGQTRVADRPALTEAARRIVAARAILGEWLGGSGGGWQDSGGVWPGMKLIEGAEAGEDDP